MEPLANRHRKIFGTWKLAKEENFDVSSKGTPFDRAPPSSCVRAISGHFWSEFWSKNLEILDAPQNVSGVMQDHPHSHLVRFGGHCGTFRRNASCILVYFVKKVYYGAICGRLFGPSPGISGASFGAKISKFLTRPKMFQEWCRITPSHIWWGLEVIAALRANQFPSNL